MTHAGPAENPREFWLPIARSIVLAHGGSIDFDSTGGETTFTIVLPRSRGGAAPGDGEDDG